jgi:hypothetical protein
MGFHYTALRFSPDALEIYPTRQEGCFIRKPVATDYLVERIRSELN